MIIKQTDDKSLNEKENKLPKATIILQKAFPLLSSSSRQILMKKDFILIHCFCVVFGPTDHLVDHLKFNRFNNFLCTFQLSNFKYQTLNLVKQEAGSKMIELLNKLN